MPPLHPILVHFPIGIILLSFIVELIARVTKRGEISRLAWWTQLAGGIALAGALGSGLISVRSLAIAESARAVFDTHQQLAFLTAACMAILLLWRFSRRGVLPSDAPAAYLLLYAFCVLALLTTGWFGGELVYGHGVGVGGISP